MQNSPSPIALAGALRALYHGGTIACPTEAVWGLSCDPFDADAVAHLLAIKRRPVEKGLILVAADIGQLRFLLGELSGRQQEILAASWPGPNTWLVPHGGRVPEWVSGDSEKVAVRVSAHSAVSALCKKWQGPLVSTSANPAGGLPAKHAFQVHRYFGSDVDYVLPGRLGESAAPTTIRDLVTGETIRA